MKKKCLFLLLTSLITVTFFTTLCIAGEPFPNKPIYVFVGFSPGGATDIPARALASVAPEFINNQPLIVVTKTGSGGTIAAKHVADSKPDGYNILLGFSGSMIFKYMMGMKTVDPWTDLKPIANVSGGVGALAVPIDSPFKTAGELVKYARENPGKLRWAHTGRFNDNHAAGAGFLSKNGIKAQDIPFTGGAPARAAVISKNVDFGFMSPHLGVGFESKMRFLGLPMNKRLTSFPDIPTFEEQGLGYMPFFTMLALAAPAGTPDNIIKYLADSVQKMTEHKAFQKTMQNSHLPSMYMNTEETIAFAKSSTAEWMPLVEILKKERDKKK